VPWSHWLAEEIVNLGWRLQRASQVEAGLFERERSFADEEWFREQERKWVVTEGQIAAETLRRSLGVPDPDKVAVVLDEEIHDNIVCLMDEAIDRRKSEVARLGDAFARDAAQGHAFSKIGRYETGIDRRLSRKLQGAGSPARSAPSWSPGVASQHCSPVTSGGVTGD